jgi:asparagine synthase (glutamine-hydrolysing)
MCGIAGEIRFQSEPSGADWDFLTRLMRRRGPDDSGIWDDGIACTLSFRRLAILDLSERGHQPMVHSSGRYALVFNGEIYNFRELRSELEALGARFRSTGDAEVLLNALALWHTDALPRLNGIFALAFYDLQERTLLLARDYAGIKPLYLMHDKRGLVFGSQYNVLTSHPWGHGRAIDVKALDWYLRFGYIPAPGGMLDSTTMIEPGTWVQVSQQGERRSGRFWEFPFPCEPSLAGEEALDAVDAAVTNAVRRQLVSDVPVGAFLSGGIDSPLVVAKMAAATQPGIKVFTVSTGDDRSDESADARMYAEELGVEQIIAEITPEHALELLPDVIEACSEPFGDYSIFPTMMVSEASRADFTVMLSGDGGDELFWGYPQRSGELIQKAGDFRSPFITRKLRSLLRQALGKGRASSLNLQTIGDWYLLRHTCMRRGWLQRIFPDLPDRPPEFSGYEYSGSEQQEVAQWLRKNEFDYHLTMVLLKVDRASMHFSQEVRVPLLDLEVVQTAAQVDWRTCLSLQSRTGKQPLRASLARHVKHQSTGKRGFEAPMSEWLRGPLREQFEELVLARHDFFGERIDRKALRDLYSRHLSGAEDHARGLWPLLSLALWKNAHLS